MSYLQPACQTQNPPLAKWLQSFDRNATVRSHDTNILMGTNISPSQLALLNRWFGSFSRLVGDVIVPWRVSFEGSLKRDLSWTNIRNIRCKGCHFLRNIESNILNHYKYQYVVSTRLQLAKYAGQIEHIYMIYTSKAKFKNTFLFSHIFVYLYRIQNINLCKPIEFSSDKVLQYQPFTKDPKWKDPTKIMQKY